MVANDAETYRNADASIEDRVDDLLARMTTREKAAQLAAPFGATVDVHVPPSTGWGAVVAALSTLDAPLREAAAAANELQRKHVEETRLGIPVLFAEEALLGLKIRDTVVFPDAIAQAATWEPQLIEEMAEAIGRQMVAMGVRMALSPLADTARDPRWGRVEETYGEDPYLVGSVATAFVRGLQNADLAAPVIATLKHFIGFSAGEGGRNTEPAQLGERELREVHGVPFEMAIRGGGAAGVMPSYNSIDGVPATGSRAHLHGLLRDRFGFDGIVISDLAAVGQLDTKHGVVADHAHALGLALKAGVDLDLDNRVSTDELVAGVEAGTVAGRDLDRAVGNVLRAKFRLGLFENPYVDIDSIPTTFDDNLERDLSRRIAAKSVILIKNDPVGEMPLLPLSTGVGAIAVIGPNADRPMGQLGNYSYQVLDSVTKRFAFAADPQSRPEDVAELLGSMGPDDATLLVHSTPVVTFLEGIRARAGESVQIRYERGCSVAGADRNELAAAVIAAAESELAIVVVGDQSGINGFGTVGEGLDSTDCELPGIQRDLVEAIVATGTPTVVVLSHGRPFTLGWMADQVPAIVSSFFGGEEAGNAVASVLFGDVNPAGRLPIALLKSAGSAPSPYGRAVKPRAYTGQDGGYLYPFGHGLSYTDFCYSDLQIDDEVSTDGTIQLSFTVSNVGDRDGEEVVQVYGRDVVARTTRPNRGLLAFSRISLAAGGAARLTVRIPTSMLALWDPSDEWVVEPGTEELFVGGSSAAIHLHGKIELHGAEHFPGEARDLFSSVDVRVVTATSWSASEEEQAAPAVAAAEPLTNLSAV
jgi:beta-glucosidase